MPGIRFALMPSFVMSPESSGGTADADYVWRDGPDGRIDRLAGQRPNGIETNATTTDQMPATASGETAERNANGALASPAVAPASPVGTPIFPDTWRQDVAAGDKAFLKTLDRFDSPAALAKAYKELTTRLSSGDIKAVKGLAPQATPEQAAAWRAEHGLPENAAVYVDGLKLSNGDVPGQAEQPLLASFAEQAMKGNWTSEQYNQAVSWYFAVQDQATVQRQHADGAFKQQAASDLMQEWGSDYAANRNAVAQFFDRNFPQDFKRDLLTARLPDGQILANHAAFNKAVLEVAKAIDPRASVLPNKAGAGLSNVESRIAEIEGKYMRAAHGSDPWKTYWSGESGARMQQEYRGLLATREKARR